LADAVEIVALESGDVVRVDFALPPETFSEPVGGISGRVTDESGSPLEGAWVGVSGGEQTNGVFRSTTTGADGTYALSGITLVDADGSSITAFAVIASADQYDTETLSGIQISDGQTVANVDFQLALSIGTEVVFEDGFEEGLAWSTSGFWNRTQGGIPNQAYPTYVTSAPDDESGGVLPSEPSGDWFAWFGTAQGNYMGEQDPLDSPLSGGLSTEPQWGELISPSISVPGSGSYVLDFKTWFEVESENPNEFGFDIMTVAVEVVSSGEIFELARLNPSVDPELENRAAIPFTSGGFNRRPIVSPVTLDLSEYAGLTIRILYAFDTIDELYNGFRGWVIDDVLVQASASGGGPALGPSLLDTSRAGEVIGERCETGICFLPRDTTPRR
jgi:hypothetical protein